MNQTVDSMMSAMGFNRMTCNDCKHAATSIAYPNLRCNLLDKYVAPTFVCVDMKAKS